MFIRLLLLFTIVPLLELYILIKLSTVFGVLTTISIIIGTGILGAYHAKKQGVSVMHRIREEMRYGRFPADELIDGLLLLIAGVVLITPGLLTDLTGFLILFPATRAHIKNWVKKKISTFHYYRNGRIDVL